MNDSETFRDLVEEVDFTLTEKRHIRARGVHLIITHLYHLPGTRCTPGEMVGDIALAGMPEPLSLGLSPRAMLIIDCLSRYRVPLTSQRIEYILNNDPFYAYQATNQKGSVSLRVWFDQRSIRVYVERIQKRLAIALQQARRRIDNVCTLASISTESNVNAYRLNATVEYVHVNRRDKRLSQCR